MNPNFLNFPGAHVIAKGLEDLQKSEKSPEALLVMIGWSSLAWAGLVLPDDVTPSKHAELELYEKITISHRDDPFSQYCALIRLLVSFQRALENLGLWREVEVGKSSPLPDVCTPKNP